MLSLPPTDFRLDGRIIIRPFLFFLIAFCENFEAEKQQQPQQQFSIGRGDDRHGHESATVIIARSGAGGPFPLVTTEAASTTDARAAAEA